MKSASPMITISRPGEYPFFDDFHQNVKGTLVVKLRDAERAPRAPAVSWNRFIYRLARKSVEALLCRVGIL